MFYYYQSHSLTKLADHFSQNFVSDFKNPLKPSWVIVQNNEIKEWLSLQFATQNDIAGNFRFIFPSEFMWVLYRLRNKDIPDVLPGDLNSMQWSIFEILSDNTDWFHEVTGFEVNIESKETRFRFSSMIADMFDQYQVYRPEMVESWLKGSLTTGYKHERWQAELWRKLNEVWNKSERSENIPRRSEAHAEILKWIGSQEDDLISQISENLYVFGLSNISKPFAQIITCLSKCRNVHYYLNNPKLKTDDPRWQNLLSVWGRPVENQKSLIKESLTAGNLDSKSTVIGAKQQANLPALQVHSCHNRRREVQVLKEEILRFMDENPSVKLCDILVMVPDPEAYAGIIETIFPNDDMEPSISVSSLYGANNGSLEHAFSELLTLLNSKYKADRVLQFLHLNPVKNNFSISEADLEIIEEWVISNKIHFGLGEGLQSPYSWKKGLNQLLSGFTMEAGELDIFKGLIPQEAISSSDEADLAARLSRFIHHLSWAKLRIADPQTPLNWMEFTHSLLRRFMGNESLGESQNITRKLVNFSRQIKFTNGSETINYELFKSWLTSYLSDQSSASGRFGNGVTISSYVPYRSVPYKFIGVLGIDEGTFPRKAVRPEYDLIYANPEAGDRILKEDDTYLFLETLQAAQNHLHFSYVGSDQQTDAKRLPSILIQQLLDILDTDYKGVKKEHKLHPFNKIYYQQEEKSAYSGLYQVIASKIHGEHVMENPAFLEKDISKSSLKNKLQITVYDIISFFSNPCKYFAENVLDVKNYDQFNAIEGREIFKLKGLDRYKLNDFLFQYLSKEEDTKIVFEYARANAMIPAYLQGEKLFQQEKENMLSLVQKLQNIVSVEPRKADVNFKFNELTITGTIEGIYGDLFISHRVGKRRAKHEIDHWLKHLFLLQNGTKIRKSLYLSVDDNSVDIISLKSERIQKDTFVQLMNWFLDEAPAKPNLAFFPESSRAYTEEYLKSNDSSKAIKKANTEWEETKYKPFAESADFNNRLIWRNEDPLETEAFQKNALLFWKPFLNALEEGE